VVAPAPVSTAPAPLSDMEIKEMDELHTKLLSSGATNFALSVKHFITNNERIPDDMKRIFLAPAPAPAPAPVVAVENATQQKARACRDRKAKTDGQLKVQPQIAFLNKQSIREKQTFECIVCKQTKSGDDDNGCEVCNIKCCSDCFQKWVEVQGENAMCPQCRTPIEVDFLESDDAGVESDNGGEDSSEEEATAEDKSFIDNTEDAGQDDAEGEYRDDGLEEEDDDDEEEGSDDAVASGDMEIAEEGKQSASGNSLLAKGMKLFGTFGL
jgi:hypothetical protein